MAARILDGKAVAGAIRLEVAEAVREMRQRIGTTPCLAAVLVGDNPASRVYVTNKIAACNEAGIRSAERRLDASAGEQRVRSTVRDLSADPDIDGILVQLPLPAGIDRMKVLLEIDPEKDVDGLHPLNVGRLAMRLEAPTPCTPQGIVALLDRCDVPIAGQRAVILGRSEIVGRPLATLLMHRDATVTVCHSKTRDLEAVTREADLLVAAIGRPAFVRGRHIRPDATVIDVGTNRVDDVALVVHPREAAAVAGRLTPVPGGVGPLTIACLLSNTLRSARRRRERPGRS
jgi:methylenetetrahydrofolate dehydrogenase (NADP+)/methenyltetrahydrofolate cyclohydrolase